MSIKYYLSRFWLALSLSFYLFIPYLSRYLDEKNRFSFHWTRGDLFSLLFCITLLGTLFFLCFIPLYVWGNKLTRKVSEISFIATLCIALAADLSHLLKLPVHQSPAHIIKLGVLAWVILGGFAIWVVFKHNKKIKLLCIMFCFISSPIIPLFTINALGYKSYISDRGSLPTISEAESQKSDDKRNIYIFIFDEWSYQRSFKNKELIKDFKNLKQFTDQALVFHNAISPGFFTFISMPAFLFQTNLRFTIKGGSMGFSRKCFHPLNQVENIFQHVRELGFYTAMIGSAIPYGELLGDSVDFCKAICVYKRLGDSFFDVAKYHLLTAGLLLPAPFFQQTRNKITHYFFNRFQVNRIRTTHKLFKTIVQNQTRPTFAVFHYMIPHYPYIFNREGYKKFFAVYKSNELSNYYGNLAYLDEKIGEIISTLKESNKFDKSLIIMTSDHSWRHDPDYDKTNWWWIFKTRRVPLFIKMPSQDYSLEIDSKFNTFKLGNYINRYLAGDFTLAEVKSLLQEENYFTPALLQLKTTEGLRSSKEIDLNAYKLK